jgi:Ras family protein T1
MSFTFPTSLRSDSSLRVEDEDSIARKVRAADVVCVVYAVDAVETLVRVKDHWMPFLRRVASGATPRPVILVGNKVSGLSGEGAWR